MEHKDWTLEQWKKVMWSDESRFTLFQSDGGIRVRREADEVMHSSWLVPTSLWGLGLWSGVGQVQQRYVPKEWGQLTTWRYWMTRSLHQWSFSSLMSWTCSKMMMPGFMGSHWEWVDQGAGDGLSSTESRPQPHWESLGCSGEDFVRLSHHQYKILVENECNSGQK